MGQDLDHLIKRIHQEGVDQAELDAADIIAKAKEEANAIVQAAKTKAETLLEQADRDAEAYTDRSIRTLEHSARDLLITVGRGIENIVSDLVSDTLDEAMDISLIKEMLIKIAEAYISHEGAESRVEYLIRPEDQKQIIDFFFDRYRKNLVHGIDVHVDDDIFKGFKVIFVDNHIEHDFTKTAIAEALSNFLRPHLADIVHRAARDGHSRSGDVA
jgi:V/A-type H+-transporting ATPase subunit E